MFWPYWHTTIEQQGTFVKKKHLGWVFIYSFIYFVLFFLFLSLFSKICFHYNNGGGPFGWCQDGDSCTKLHICEKHLQGYCRCHRAHDFHDPQPLKTLQARGVPSWLFGFLKLVYINKTVLRNHDDSDDLQQHLRTFSAGDTWAAANYPDDAGRDDGLNRRQMRGGKKSSEAVKGKSCMAVLKLLLMESKNTHHSKTSKIFALTVVLLFVSL